MGIWLTALVSAQLVSANAPPALESVLNLNVDWSAAEDFARIWRETGGKPDAAALGPYIAQGGSGLKIFTPNRIQNAEKLAARIAERPVVYRDAVERCLPWVKQTNGDYRAISLAFRGLFPDRAPAKVAIVVGRDNSGGTAAPGMQVIGLEVLCRISPSEAAFKSRLRSFYAHEGVHTLQTVAGPAVDADPLLAYAIAEGTADYLAHLVTGAGIDPARDSWARSRAGQVFADFLRDREIVRRGVKADGELDEAAQKAMRNWLANAGSAPPGWPDELGYWVGMIIAEAYVEASDDKRRAIDELLAMSDPAPILDRARSRLPALASAR